MDRFVTVLVRVLIGISAAYLLLILCLIAGPLVIFPLAWIAGVLGTKYGSPSGRLLLLLSLGVLIVGEAIIMFALVFAALAMSTESVEVGALILLFAGLFVALLNHHCQSFASVHRRRLSPDRWARIEARIPLAPHEIVMEQRRDA